MRIPRFSQHENSEFVAEAEAKSKAKAKPRKPPSSRRLYDRAVVEALDLIQSSTDHTPIDFESVTPRAVVGLFIVFHTRIYGVSPDELRMPLMMSGAISAAKRLVEKDFNGRIDLALEFVRWTWAKEAKSFKTRTTDWRIGWRWQLCSKPLVTDYRVWVSKSRALGVG